MKMRQAPANNLAIAKTDNQFTDIVFPKFAQGGHQYGDALLHAIISEANRSQKGSFDIDIDELKNIQLSKTSMRIMPSFFTKDNNKSLFSALLKLRYKDCNVDWQDSSLVSRIVAKDSEKFF